MMKKITLALVAFVAAVAAGFAFAGSASAQQSSVFSERHKLRIVESCTSAKASLARLHKTDTSMRVNRGQFYEFIGSKLMARLNSRLAINKIDASKLIVKTSEYEQALGEFRDTYRAYEEQLVATSQVDCHSNPVEFYQEVAKARASRAVVQQKVADINRLINEYYQIFVEFRAEYTKASQGVRLD